MGQENEIFISFVKLIFFQIAVDTIPTTCAFTESLLEINLLYYFILLLAKLIQAFLILEF